MTTSDSSSNDHQSHPTTVLLVGHCTPDTWMLRTAVGRVLADAVIQPVNDEQSLEDQLREAKGPVVMLVNRLLDGRFPHADGIRLLEHHATSPGVGLLISNLPDAQEEASRVGAVKGFGKTAINDDATATRLREADDAAHSSSAAPTDS